MSIELEIDKKPKKEIMKDLSAILRMCYFRVKLYRVQTTCFIAHGSARTFFCMSNNTETLRNSADTVGVAHPANTIMWYTAEKRTVINGKKHLSVLAGIVSTGYAALLHPGHQLRTIADSQYRNSQFQHGSVKVR